MRYSQTQVRGIGGWLVAPLLRPLFVYPRIANREDERFNLRALNTPRRGIHRWYRAAGPPLARSSTTLVDDVAGPRYFCPILIPSCIAP